MRPLTLLAALAVLLPSTAAGQHRLRAGLGVSLDLNTTGNLELFSSAAPSGRSAVLHIPVEMSSRIRVEPTVGYFRTTEETSDDIGSTSDAFSIWRVGLGLLYQFSMDSSVRLFVGPRAGFRRLRRNRETFFGTPERFIVTRTDWYVTGAMGAEYFLADRFSLGGEAQLTWTSFGNADFSVDPAPPTPLPEQRTGGSEVETNGLITVRWYFAGR